MKKIISVLAIWLVMVQLFAGTGGWNNYPTTNIVTGPETFLFGTSTTNKLITFANLESSVQAELPYNTNALEIPLSYAGTDTSNILVNCSSFTNSGKIVFALTLTNNTFIHITNFPSGLTLQIQYYQNSIGTYQRYYDTNFCPLGFPPIGTNASQMNADTIGTYGLSAPFHFFVGQCVTNAP